MEEEIIKLYRAGGYTPEDTVKELIGLIGAAILSLPNEIDTAYYSNDKFTVKVEVIER